jgi:hypothetical protein
MNKTATTIPWDPDCTKFPTRKELPQIPGAPVEAAWVWGDDDYVCFALLMEKCLANVCIDWTTELAYTDACCGCCEGNQDGRDCTSQVRI